MKKDNPTRCGKCGGNTPPFTMFANASTGESYALCINCMSNRSSQGITNLANLDKLIEEQEEMITKMEPMLKEMGDMELPPELEAFAFTPMKTYKMAQMTLASLKFRRLELLTKGENEERLQYELDKKIEDENYEEASSIQKRLDDLKATPEEKRKPPMEEEKKKSVLFDSDEEADGRCINCNERFPKPPGLFHKYNIGDCHDMCLVCCVHEVPKHIKTIKMADEMIEEIEKFAEMMDKMSLLGKMMREDLKEIDLEEETNKIKTEGQSASHMMVKVLKMRRDFLDKNNEDAGMIEAADLANQMLRDTFGKNSILDLSSLLNGVLNDEEEKYNQEQKEIKSKESPKQKPKQTPKEIPMIEIIEKAKSWYGEEEGTAEKCESCQKYPIKNTSVFSDYDLGKCERLCWSCGMQEIGLYPTNIQTTIDMLEEIKGISNVLDEFIVIGELHEKGEFDIEKLKEIDMEKMEVSIRSQQQYIARKLIELLEQRKNFLAEVGEKGDMVSLADKVIRMMRGRLETDDSDSDKMGKIFGTIEEAMDEEE